MGPLTNSQTLADWAASTLKARGIDEIASWRMVEYWLQVELFRAIQAGQAGNWRHVGDYEQPYHTESPRTGAKTKTKWIDLVLAEPDIQAPNSVAWIELKDVGRSKTTAVNNAKGLGRDLAALWTMDVKRTKKIWLDPLPHSLDRGRLEEWNRYGPGLDCTNQLIGQVVLYHKSLCSDVAPARIKELWVKQFQSVLKHIPDVIDFDIAEAGTTAFIVFGLVKSLSERITIDATTMN